VIVDVFGLLLRGEAIEEDRADRRRNRLDRGACTVAALPSTVPRNVWVLESLPDDLGRLLQDARRDGHSERLGGLQINSEHVFR